MLDSPQRIEYAGLEVSVARLTADRWRKVSPRSQLFRCAAFKILEHSPRACKDNLAFIFNRKSSFATD